MGGLDVGWGGAASAPSAWTEASTERMAGQTPARDPQALGPWAEGLLVPQPQVRPLWNLNQSPSRAAPPCSCFC